MRLVAMRTPGLRIPRVVMHWCAASMTTAAPRGFSTSWMVSATCAVRASWICIRLANTSTRRASLEIPTTRPAGR